MLELAVLVVVVGLVGAESHRCAEVSCGRGCWPLVQAFPSERSQRVRCAYPGEVHNLSALTECSDVIEERASGCAVDGANRVVCGEGDCVVRQRYLRFSSRCVCNATDPCASQPCAAAAPVCTITSQLQRVCSALLGMCRVYPSCTAGTDESHIPCTTAEAQAASCSSITMCDVTVYCRARASNTVSTCQDDTDCSTEEYCREVRNYDDTCGTARTCIPRVGLGKPCELGIVRPCFATRCQEGLICTGNERRAFCSKTSCPEVADPRLPSEWTCCLDLQVGCPANLVRHGINPCHAGSCADGACEVVNGTAACSRHPRECCAEGPTCGVGEERTSEPCLPGEVLRGDCRRVSQCCKTGYCRRRWSTPCTTGNNCPKSFFCRTACGAQGSVCAARIPLGGACHTTSAPCEATRCEVGAECLPGADGWTCQKWFPCRPADTWSYEEVEWCCKHKRICVNVASTSS
eukprot:Sspe_Gene.80530::Locus_50898_Transcript_1_1_Confidence_1.000_Length_1502::g.80530::m.80530